MSLGRDGTTLSRRALAQHLGAYDVHDGLHDRSAFVGAPDDRVRKRDADVRHGDHHDARRHEPALVGVHERPALARLDARAEGEEVVHLAQRGRLESKPRELVAQSAAKLGIRVVGPDEQRVVGEVAQRESLAAREAV